LNMKKLMLMICAILILSASNSMAKELGECSILKKADLLQALNIYSTMLDEGDAYEQIVNRGECIAAIIRMTYPDEITENVHGACFDDVNSDNPYFAEILMAKSMGLISGNSYNKYAPNEDMLTEYAIAVVRKVLGYDMVPDKEYLNSGITANLEKQSGKLTEKDLITLLYNALDIDKVSYQATGNGKYKKSKGCTILSDNLNISIHIGIIDSNEYTGLYTPFGTKKANCITIDGKKYVYKENLNDKLGCLVKIYYKDLDDNAGDKIVYIEERSCEHVLINYDDIEGFSNNIYNVCYQETDKHKKYEISNKSAIIYNGKQYASTSRMIPSYGDVELVDNDKDGIYDVVKIRNYGMCFVTGIFKEDNMVYSSDDRVLNFDDDTIVNIDSKLSSFESIPAQSIMLIRESINTEGSRLCILDVSTKKVQGSIKLIDEDTMRIGDVDYKISPYMETDVSAGDQGAFYFDANGRISYFVNKLLAGEQYGFMLAASYDKFKNKGEVKIFNDKSEEIILQMAERITFDDTGINAEKAVDTLSGVFDLIRYKVNEKNMITYIDTAAEGGNLTKVKYDGNATLFMYRSRGKGFCESKNASNQYLNSPFIYFVDGSTKLFYKGATKDDIKKFKVGSIAEITDTSTFSLEGYDMGDNGICQAIVIDNSGNSSPQIYHYNGLFYINNVVTRADENGEIYYGLKGLWNGVETEYEVMPDDFPNVTAIQSGDIIQYIANNQNEITAINYVYAKSGKVPDGFNKSDIYITDLDGLRGAASDTALVMIGKSINRYNNIIELSYYLSGAEKKGLIDGSTGMFLTYDGKKYKAKSTRDIPAKMSENQKLLVHIRAGVTYELVLFEEKEGDSN